MRKSRLIHIINEAVSMSIGKLVVKDELEKLGYRSVRTKQYYNTFAIFRIWSDEFNDDVRRKTIQVLNRCGWRICNEHDAKDITTYDEREYHEITVETIYGIPENGDSVFYHATPKSKTKKILKVGLCPRDEGKRDDYRGPRVYLSRYNNPFVFDSVLDGEYDVLEVDLRGSGIRVYKDELADNAVYTLENIPPSRIRVTENISDERRKDRTTFYEMVKRDITSKYGFNQRDDKIIGSIGSVRLEFYLNILAYCKYTGKPYEISKWRVSNRRSSMSRWKGFNTPEDAVDYIRSEIEKEISRQNRK